MTAGSQVGYQPKPLPPSDFKEFLKYRQATNTSIREVFYKPTERFKVINPKKTRKIKKI
jgi:hypothetical protein